MLTPLRLLSVMKPMPVRTGNRVNIAQLLQNVGCLDPAKLKQHAPFQFAAPALVERPASAVPQLIPSRVSQRLSMSAFLSRRKNTTWTEWADLQTALLP